MLGQNAGGVLHGHGIAGERHHARIQRHVARVERRLQQLGLRRLVDHRVWGSVARGVPESRSVGEIGVSHVLRSPAKQHHTRLTAGSCPLCLRTGEISPCTPVSRELRRLPPSVSKACLQHARYFPERQLPAVLRPERFRGGCAFGAGDWPLTGPAGLFRGDQWLHRGTGGSDRCQSDRFVSPRDMRSASREPCTTCREALGERQRRKWTPREGGTASAAALVAGNRLGAAGGIKTNEQGGSPLGTVMPSSTITNGAVYRRTGS